MRWLADKPAVIAVLPFMAGLCAANCLHPPIFLPFSLSTIFLLLCLYRRARHISLLSLLFLLGFLHLRIHVRDNPSSIKEFADLPHAVAIEGVICEPVELRARGIRTVVRTDSVWVLNRGYRTEGKCLLQLYVRADLDYGERIVAHGQLRLPAGERNPGQFNYQKYLAARQINAIMRVESASHILVLNEGEGNPIMRVVLCPVRSFVISVIDRSLSGQPAALLKALLIGARADLDPELQEGFANVGVIHVLAVSGLHVGFVLTGLTGLLSFVRIPNPWRSLLIMVCLVFYALLTGMRSSVCRAVILAILYLTGLLLQRRTHLLNMLAIAAFVILCRSPLELFEPGFQLSFIAVLGIVLLYGRLSVLLEPWLHRMRDKGHIAGIWIIELFCVSLAAQVATMPLTVYYFNRLSLIGIVANIIVVPAISLIVAMGLVALFASSVSLSVGAIYMATAWLLLHVLIVFVEKVQHLPLAWLPLPCPSALHMLIYASCLLSFILWPHLRARKFFFFMTLFLLNLLLWTGIRRHDGLKVTFFDVGQGDAALFEFPNGKTMLVDAGDRTDYLDCGQGIIYPFLVRQGIKRIDHLLLTHNHSDHVGGAPYLLDKKCVGRLVRAVGHDGSALDSLIQACAAQNGVLIKNVQAGDTLLIDENVLILILHPTKWFTGRAENVSDANNCSIVFKCVYFDHAILMTGDAEKVAEASLLRYNALLRSPLVKIAHHGSATAGDAAFRRQVQAECGVVSVAKFNRFALPCESLLADYEEERTRILRTSHVGAIQFILYPEKMVQL
ncbi:DNA internalization-related competence protein ComEC/Rec2 [candidate division KSB1 bacterium]|nr:DNA internalization-related competence protein ComEC/Rec2 [candidate division KSB1 bacterium]